MLEEGAGGTASGLWPRSLSLGFLLEPSPSWAVREKRGYWLLIPNITQTLENSRKRAKTRCREGDRGPARQTGLWRAGGWRQCPTGPKHRAQLLVLLSPVRGMSIIWGSPQHPFLKGPTPKGSRALLSVLVLPSALLTLGNPHLVKTNVVSRNRATRTCARPQTSLTVPSVSPTPENQSPISLCCRWHIQLVLG